MHTSHIIPDLEYKRETLVLLAPSPPPLGPVQADKQPLPTRAGAHPQDLRVQDGF